MDVACSEEPIFRGRVYCYELNHRLRCELAGGCKPDDSYPYKLDGEVDKAGRPTVYPNLGSVNHGFVVHLPGSNINNSVVIEVKPVSTKINGLEKDLRTLKGFLDLEKGKYHLAIMLVYGDGEHDLPEAIISKVRDAQRDYGSRILLLWHKGPGEIPEIK